MTVDLNAYVAAGEQSEPASVFAMRNKQAGAGIWGHCPQRDPGTGPLTGLWAGAPGKIFENGVF